MNLWHLALTFAVASVVSAAATPLCAFLARRFGILDHPTDALKTHKVPTPYLGGFAIAAGVFVALGVVRLLTHFPTGTLTNLRGIVLGSLVLMVIGFIDDLKRLSFRVKFLFQVVAALCLLRYGIEIRFIQPDYLATALTVIWVVGVTNACNIIDVMDGLAASVAALAALAFLAISLPSEAIYVNVAAAALAGACLGFLPWNWTPARIFMGDTGSLVIGFLLAALSLGTSYTRMNDIALYSPLLILGVPLYDTALVMVLRMRKGQNVFLGSRDHFALRLEALGFSRPQVVLLTAGVTVILGLAAWGVTLVTQPAALAIYLVVGAAALWIGARLSRVPMER